MFSWTTTPAGNKLSYLFSFEDYRNNINVGVCVFAHMHTTLQWTACCIYIIINFIKAFWDVSLAFSKSSRSHLLWVERPLKCSGQAYVVIYCRDNYSGCFSSTWFIEAEAEAVTKKQMNWQPVTALLSLCCRHSHVTHHFHWSTAVAQTEDR